MIITFNGLSILVVVISDTEQVLSLLGTLCCTYSFYMAVPQIFYNKKNSVVAVANWISKQVLTDAIFRLD